DDRYLVRVRRVRPHDLVVLGDVAERVRVGQRDALEHLGDVQLGVIHELLHDVPPLVTVRGSYRGWAYRRVGRLAHSSASASNMTATATAPASRVPMDRS